MTILPKFIAVAAVAVMAGCNGTAVPTPNPPAIDELKTRAEMTRISQEIFDGLRFEDPTPKALVPLNGEARYAGTLRADIVTPSVTSDVGALIEMGVDFRTDSVGGIVGNFVERDGDRLDGVLTLQSGRLSRTSNSREVAIFSDMAGTLRGPGGERIVVDADLVGGFAGRNVDYIGAEIDGRVSVDGERGTIDGLTALERGRNF